jgi:translation initiation factor IF-3
VAEVAVDNGQQSIVVQQSRAIYQVSQPAKRSIVNLEDDDPPTNPAVDFMEYAFRNKKPGVEQQNKQRSAQLRDKMKCCQCRCLCDPIQHGSNLYCSKCLPNNGPLY